MDYFAYRDGRLACEGVDVESIAHAVGTPTYVYSAATLTLHVKRLAEAFAPIDPLMCFAVKCCPNVHVLRTLVDLGLGMDVVSGGELARALAAGCDPAKIVFAGVGKTEVEIRAALAAHLAAPTLLTPDARAARTLGSIDPSTADVARPIACFNVESEGELETIARIARQMGVRCRAAVRVNPGVKAGGHAYITTADIHSKFGVSPDHALELFRRFARDPHVQVDGLHMHIGSSILTPEPYAEAVRRLLALADQAGAAGAPIRWLDIGGGFGADYHTGDAPGAEAFAKVIVPLIRPRLEAARARGEELRIVIEPGRTIAANAGLLLTRVQYVKHAAGKKYIVTDAGMQTLLRPSLYQAFHFMWPTRVGPQHEPPTRTERPTVDGVLEAADVVGPVCESGDFLARDRALPPVAPGDLIAIFAAGAYGMSMASRYNSHCLPAEVLVRGESSTTIRRRETIDDQLAHELPV
jgi:diaminopimelate decarboxylase